MKLHKASIKLTSVYLAIIMFISLFFSINLYRASIQEFDRGINKQSRLMQRFQGNFGPMGFEDQLMQERLDDFNTARNRIISDLFLINIFILVAGGLLSYYLARKTLKPMEDAHEAQKRFTADASHELRTPIAAMQSETEVTLMDPKLNLQKAKEQLNSNLEEMAKLTALSAGLLELAQLENNGLCKEDVYVTDFVQGAIDQVLPLAEQKNILISFKADNKLKVCGDNTSLREAMVTIIDNAIKYSPQKKEIKIIATQEQKNIIIKVKDQGVGINKEDQEHIFDRFYRSDTARDKNKNAGYGLGLAIAKKIIELHKGYIDVSSQQGKGTVFIITLPIKH